MLIAVILALIGLALIFFEFFMPGTILAIMGGILLIISGVLCFKYTSIMWGTLYSLLLLALVAITCKLALIRMKKSKNKNRFFLEKDQEGYTASSFDSDLIGKTAIVSTELKPAGHIVVEGKQYQALCETGFVSNVVSVQIVSGRGSFLIVREI